MKPSKLFSFALVGLVAWQYQTLIGGQLGVLGDLYPTVMTYVEMQSFRGKLREYVWSHDHQMPRNVGNWLKLEFRKPGKSVAEDYFGTPYRADRSTVLSRYEANRAGRQAPGPALRSCGPDRRCGTGDDIVLPVEPPS